MEEIVEIKRYTINGKVFILQGDFAYEDIDWIDSVMNRLSAQGNEVSGKFTREDIEKTLSIILLAEDGSKLTHNDFMKIKESTSVKILADFFLSKAIQGSIMQNFSTILNEENNVQLMKRIS